MKISVAFSESRIFTKEHKQWLQNTIKETANHAGELLGIKRKINFKVYPFISNPPPMLSRGCACSKELEMIVSPHRDAKLKQAVKSTVYHEIHHLARGFIDVEATLIDAVFSEGLAVVFEMENIPGYTPQCAIYDPAVLQGWLPILRMEKDNTNYDYQKWFEFEQGELGYSMGKYFVDLIFRRYPYLNSTMLVRAPTEELLDLLYSSGINLK